MSSEVLRQQVTQALVDELVRRARKGSLNVDGVTVVIRKLHQHAELLSEPDLVAVALDAAAALRARRPRKILVTITQYEEKVFIVSPVGQVPHPR